MSLLRLSNLRRHRAASRLSNLSNLLRRCAAPLLLLAAAAPGIATARVIDAQPNGFTIENTEVVPVTPQVAYRALVDDIGKWWPADHTWFGKGANLSIQERIGGCFCEIEGPRQVEHMRIAFADPGRLLRMLGGLGPLQGMGLDGVLEWRFEAVEGGTKITLWYRAGGYTPDDLTKFVPVVDQVQGLQLGGLAQFLRKAAPK